LVLVELVVLEMVRLLVMADFQVLQEYRHKVAVVEASGQKTHLLEEIAEILEALEEVPAIQSD
jgi:hypothetical protein